MENPLRLKLSRGMPSLGAAMSVASCLRGKEDYLVVIILVDSMGVPLQPVGWRGQSIIDWQEGQSMPGSERPMLCQGSLQQ